MTKGEHINKQTEALKLALDWFKCYANKSMSRNNAEALADEVVDAITKALAKPSDSVEQEPSQFGSPKMQALILAKLAQPEQEPVAWFSTLPDGRLSIKIVGKPTEGN